MEKMKYEAPEMETAEFKYNKMLMASGGFGNGENAPGTGDSEEL